MEEKSDAEPKQEKKKSGKGLVVITIFSIILAAAGIGFGVYGMTRKLSATDVINAMKNDEEIEAAVTVVDTNKDEDKAKTEIVEDDSEITITNPYILRDLNHKFAILHNEFSGSRFIESSDHLITTSIWNNTKALYSDGTGVLQRETLSRIAIRDNVKPVYAWGSKYSSGTKLRDFVVSLKNSSTTAGQLNDSYFTFSYINNTGFIPYAEANQAYHDLTGATEDLVKENYTGDESNKCGPNFYYVASVDGFLNVDSWIVGGCGGAGYGGVYVKKEGFTAKKNEAYIYVKLLTTSGVKSNLDTLTNYCHVYNRYFIGYNEDVLEVIDQIEAGNWCKFPDDYYETHPDKFNDALRYRFVFTKNNEGVYSFSKVELVHK